MKKKYVWIVIIIGLVILIINYLPFLSKVDQVRYNILDKNKYSCDYLFKDSVISDINLYNIIGNENEQMLFYSYGNLEIVVWNIRGFREIDLSDIQLYMFDEFNKIRFNPKRFTEIGQVKISSVLQNLVGDTLNYYTDSDVDIIDHFENKHLSILSIRSVGFALGDTEDFKLKFETSEKSLFNIALRSEKTGSTLIVLTSGNNEDFQERLLWNLLNNSIYNHE